MLTPCLKKQKEAKRHYLNWIVLLNQIGIPNFLTWEDKWSRKKLSSFYTSLLSYSLEIKILTRGLIFWEIKWVTIRDNFLFTNLNLSSYQSSHVLTNCIPQIWTPLLSTQSVCLWYLWFLHSILMQSVSSHLALLAFFINLLEPKILRLVKRDLLKSKIFWNYFHLTWRGHLWIGMVWS